MRIEVPEYKTFVDFPDDTPTDVIESTLNAYFPSKNTPDQNGLWEGLVKPTLKAAVKVPLHTAASMAQMPVSGLAAIGKLVTSKGDLNAANQVLQENQSVLDNTYLTTPEERKASENINLAMKPFEMAGEGWSKIGQATGIPYAAPVLGTAGEASAMFGLGGAGKALKARLNKTKPPAAAPTEAPLRKPVSAQWLKDNLADADLQKTSMPREKIAFKPLKDKLEENALQEALRPKEISPEPYQQKGSFWDYLDQMNRQQAIERQPIELPSGSLDRGTVLGIQPPEVFTEFDAIKYETLSKTDPAFWNGTDKLFMDSMNKARDASIEKPIEEPVEAQAPTVTAPTTEYMGARPGEQPPPVKAGEQMAVDASLPPDTVEGWTNPVINSTANKAVTSPDSISDPNTAQQTNTGVYQPKGQREIVQSGPSSQEAPQTQAGQGFAEVKAKEPWQMTREEYISTQKPPGDNFSTYLKKIDDYRKYGDEKISGSATGNVLADKIGAQADTIRKVEIRKAISEGKPVPAEVLSEHPELAELVKQRQAESTPAHVLADNPAVSIGDLHDYALTDKTNKKKSVSYQAVSPEEAATLKEKTGLDLGGYNHSVDNYGINHAYKEHGDIKAETSRGQAPITRDDFLKIPEIINAHDKVEYGGKDSIGNDVIKYEKRVNGSIYYVEEVRKGKRELALKSLWKRPAEPRATSLKEGVAQTSETLSGKSPKANNNLLPADENVKTEGRAVSPQQSSLLKNERGSFSLKYKDDVRDSLKKNIPQGTDAAKVNEMFERTETKLAEREATNLKNIKNALVRSMVDISGNIKKALISKDPLLGKQVVMDRELLSGASAKASLIIEETGKKIFGDLRSDELEILNRVIQSRRIIDIDNYKEGVKHPAGLTGKEHAEYLTALKNINPELSKNINARADMYFKTMREQVKELQKEGILTPESAKELMAHEYSPRQFFQYLDPEISYNVGGRKITVPDSGIKSLDGGSIQLLKNNAEQLLSEVVARTQARIFRNQANKSLYEFAEKVPANGIVRIAKEVSRTKGGKPIYEDTPGGFEKVKVMIDGKTKEMIMPREMAQEWVQTDPLINQTLATVVGTISGAKLLRPIATGYNPAFALTNMPRDIALVWSSTMEYSKHLPMAGAQLVKDLAKVAPDVIKRSGRVKEYINDGGGMNFLTHYGRFSGKGFVGEKLNSLGNIMGWIGETSELWTRMALRERAIQNGASPKEATWIARRYLDFNQGGNVAKGIDTAIPYLNAAIQGTRALLKGAKNNPGIFTYKMAQLGTVATSLYLANYLANPECWQSITDREKEANFIITTPLYFVDDKGQKKHYYMKIAKDQGQRVVTSLFDALMARQFEGKLPTQQVLMGLQDFASVAGLPPTLAAGISYLMNKDTWTNEDVWKGPKDIAAKEEYRKTTHPFWVSVGQSIGLSPERMSNAAGHIIPPNNPFIGLVGGGYKMLTGDLPQEIQDKSAMQFITEIPSVRRVLSTTNPYTPYKESLEDIKKEEATKNFTQNRDFDSLTDKYLKSKNSQDFQALVDFAAKLPEADQERLTRRFEHQAKLFQVPDRTWYLNALNLPPEARAIVFYDRFSKSTDQEKQQMLEIADRVGGFDSDRFLDKFEELMATHGKRPAKNI